MTLHKLGSLNRRLGLCVIPWTKKSATKMPWKYQQLLTTKTYSKCVACTAAILAINIKRLNFWNFNLGNTSFVTWNLNISLLPLKPQLSWILPEGTLTRKFSLLKWLFLKVLHFPQKSVEINASLSVIASSFLQLNFSKSLNFPLNVSSAILRDHF